MPRISRTALVPYSAEQMYQLVNDVHSYPEFVPGCIGSRVLESSIIKMTAEVDILKAGIKKTFVTCNILDKNQSIFINLVDGPFDNLIGGWKFVPFSRSTCQIKFYLDFKFSNILIELMFCRIFEKLTSNIVQAFKIRAKEVYNLKKLYS